MGDPGESQPWDAYAAEFLRVRGESPGADREAFLRGVPDRLREATRRAIDEAVRMEGLLGGLAKPPPNGTGGFPTIPGFRIERAIGSGALGMVYAAWDEALERRVAVKVLLPRTAGSVRSHILQEARKAAALKHPSIVTIHSIAGGDDVPAIVMELVEGFPVDRSAPSLSFRQRARIFLAVARALSAAHKRGIIHRDLKPDNILLTPALVPKILDFGLAIATGSEEQSTGAFVGTPLYASPEQVEGRVLSPASDVFSFGSVMFALLAGRPPFEGSDVLEVLRGIRDVDPPFPRSLAGDVPRDLQTICLACLAKSPGDRPTAAEVARDLSRYLAGEPARLRPALYSDLLRRRVSAHVESLREWTEQGILSREEEDRLGVTYRRILSDEDHWILDDRRLSRPQVFLYAATWVAVVGSALLVWFGRESLEPFQRWTIPAWSCLSLVAVGLVAHHRREVVASMSFLAGAILAVIPAVLSGLAVSGLLAEQPETVERLLRDTEFSNDQVFAASASALALSLFALWFLRRTAFVWTGMALLAGTWVAFLITRGFLDLKPHEQALRLLPLVLVEPAALAFEARGLVRWAVPLHLLALLVLVGAPDVMAMDGKVFTLLGIPKDGLPSFLDRDYAGFAMNGLLFLVLVLLSENRRSLDLRRGARILQTIVPIHLLGSLFVNAENARGPPGWPAIPVCAAAVAGILLLSPWRNRRSFLITGLAGTALAFHLPLRHDLVAGGWYPVAVLLAGMAAALAAFRRLDRPA